jgi:hypothetical protein
MSDEVEPLILQLVSRNLGRESKSLTARLSALRLTAFLFDASKVQPGNSPGTFHGLSGSPEKAAKFSVDDLIALA